MQALLSHFSYRTAIISLGLGYGSMGAIALYFIRERVPVPRRIKGDVRHSRARIPTSFFKNSALYAFSGAILFTSFGNFLPAVYLPSYAADIGLSVSNGTFLVAMMKSAIMLTLRVCIQADCCVSASSIVGLLVLGHLSDRWPTRGVVTLSCMGASVSCFLLWGFATSLTVLIVFSLAFGFFALGFASVWTKLATIVAQDDPLVPPLVFSVFAFSRGVGNVCSGLIGDALLKHGGLRNVRYAYGVENYVSIVYQASAQSVDSDEQGPLLLYVGSVIALGSIAGISYREK